MRSERSRQFLDVLLRQLVVELLLVETDDLILRRVVAQDDVRCAAGVARSQGLQVRAARRMEHVIVLLHERQRAVEDNDFSLDHHFDMSSVGSVEVRKDVSDATIPVVVFHR